MVKMRGVSTEKDLLEALVGGVSSDNWARLARSRTALKVRIHHLRSKGHAIESIPLPAPPGKKGKAPVLYRLANDALPPTVTEIVPPEIVLLYRHIQEGIAHRSECDFHRDARTCDCDHDVRSAIAFAAAVRSDIRVRCR